MGEDNEPFERVEESLVPKDEDGLVADGSRRAAVALEDAGELRAAARLFEYVGEHGQAAALRLEHASTVRSDEERLRILREGAARIGGQTPEGRELHRALARVLVERAAGLAPGAHRRAIVLEAAQSYENAADGARAGQIYERLGLLRRAERAYRDAGEIEAYERVLEALEDRERAARDLRRLQESIDEALREGRRRQARRLMRDHVAHRRSLGRPPRAHLARELAELETRTPRDGRVELAYTTTQGEGRTRLVVAPSLRVGRAPGLELVLDAPAVSRNHLMLRLGGTHEGRLAIFAEDLGSKAGTFFDGEALQIGEAMPLDIEGELAVGIAATWSWMPGPPSHTPMGLLGPLEADPAYWLTFAPDGAQLQLAPDLHAPAWIRSAGEFVELAANDNCAISLQGRALGPGAAVELLVGDRVRLSFDGGTFDFEVRQGALSR